MKVLLLQQFNKSQKDFIYNCINNSLIIYDFEYANEVIEEVDIIVGNNINDTIIHKAKSLKYIFSTGTGVDKINLHLLKQNNIRLFNTHSHSIYVAEFAVAMMFTLLKRLNIHDSMMRQGTWWRPNYTEIDKHYISNSIIDASIGIIGFGQIGKNIAKFLKGFPIKINVFDVIENDSLLQNFDNAQYLKLTELIEQSDIIFISLPLTDKTKELISYSELCLAKNNSLWINISRGEIFNEQALYSALINNTIGGVAIDNWSTPYTDKDNKKYPSEKYPFHLLPNVLLSPYRAIYVEDKFSNLIDVCENLKSIINNGILINEIDLEKGY